MSAALEIEGLVTGYGKTQILREVTFQLPEGGCVGLIGPNGHGKTTLMRTVSGLHRAWSGAVRLRGENAIGRSPQQLVERGVAHVPQGDLLFGDLTVEEHLLIPLRREKRHARGPRLRSAYELFPRLEERRRQPARTLSGGEKRMLSLARGMLLGGTVLLIDEPSLGLSPLMVQTVYAHISTLADTGRSILVVEENPVRLRGLADMLYLLDRGAIVAGGPTDELLENESLLHTYLGHGTAGDVSA